MKKKKFRFKGLTALVLALMMMLTSVPLTAFAAPNSDIPADMLDNVYLDALAYTGYDVQAQKSDGTIFVKSGSSVSASIRSNIGYGTGPSGLETVSSSSTPSGKAPDISKYESQGLCCASYVSYVYYNYMPNVAGIDTSGTPCPSNPRSASAYNTAANAWVTNGQARRISFTQNSDGSSFVPSEEIPIGSLIVFRHIPTGSIAHVAIYAGHYNGKYWVTHVGNDRGPEFSTIVGMSKGDYPEAVVQVVVPEFVEAYGAIEVQKNDTNGKGLAGAYFVATSTEDSSLQYLIGPTNSKGYAISNERVKFGTYKVKETVFPTNYRSYGQTEWTVNVTSDNNGVAKFTAVNELIPGNIKIVKESEDGDIGGKEFNIKGNGVDIDVTSNNDGTFTVKDLKPGTYTVSEKEYEEYVPQKAQTVTVVSGGTAIVNFNNQLRRGSLQVTKTSEDGFVQNIEFRLYGTSLSGQEVSVYATTDSSGKATFKDVPIGTYTLTEENVSVKYVVPEDQTVEILWNETVEASVENRLKKWRAEMFKMDAELAGFNGEDVGVPMALSLVSDDYVDEYGYPLGATQGNATLEGAKYGVFKYGELVKTYTTDRNGYFITDYFPCGDGWTIEEIEPSEGYLLNDEIYYVPAYCEWYDIEYNTIRDSLYETIIKSNIVLVKHSDDGSTQIETPEEGAEFEIYLKSAGSYENAKDTERDFITIDKHGFGVSRDLPYGTYVVKQVSGKPGVEMLPAFDVKIENHADIYSFIINNAPITALIDVVKKDATTGNVIPAAGVGFKVRNLATGEFISQHLNYPTPMDIDVFYTDETGRLRLPEALGYGEYELIEQTVGGADGYVLDATPVKFVVDGSAKIVTVEKLNEPQMGTITIEKKGEVFASVEKDGDKYVPVYKEMGLADAVFGVYAAEDIYTLDGTLRYSKDQKVATLTTAADGTVTSEPLFLGKFTLIEEKAPHGTVLNTEPIPAELTYAGENVKVTATTVSIVNERQKVVISLLKKLEKDDTYGIGMSEEYKNIRFGLYATETLISADGKEIPKDGLLDLIGVDENGVGVFTADIPVGAKLYVKEYATDAHYQLSDTAYPVEFNYEDSSIASVLIDVNNGEAIENTIIRGNIKGLKVDEDNTPVAEAVFGLFKADETEFATENALATAVSDVDGLFAFNNIPYGEWIIKELSCPEHLVLSDETIPVTISQQDQLIEITVVNEIIKGSVEGVKTDDKNTPIEGVVFGLFASDTTEFTEENAIMLSTSDKDGLFSFADLRFGKYLIKELSCGEEFVMCEDVFEIDINEDGQVIKLTVTNKRISGKVQVIKVSSKDHDKKLSGAVFELYVDVNKNGVFDIDVDTLYGKLTETETGIYSIDGLGYNGYFLYEQSCPEGFTKDDRYFYFQIKTDNEIVTVENESGVGFVNEPIPVPEVPDSPQTGDNSHIWLWVMLVSGSLAAIVFLKLTSRKKRKSM